MAGDRPQMAHAAASQAAGMTPIVTIAKLVWALAPIARDVLAALHRDSDGGKRITDEELEAIFSARKVEVRREINRRAGRRRHR